MDFKVKCARLLSKNNIMLISLTIWKLQLYIISIIKILNAR